MRLAIVTSHPIQYQAPWFRALARELELTVLFAHKPDAQQQANAGYGVAFDWDVDLLAGYTHRFLRNVARSPNVYSFRGCDTPEVADILARDRPDACIVSGWYLKTHWQTILACRKHGIPVLVRGDSQLTTPRSLGKRAAKAVLYQWVMSRFDGFLCVGQRNMQYVLHYGAPSDAVFFVPHFVDDEHFRTRSRMTGEQRDAQRAAFGIQPGELAVLYVGRFIELKRLRDVIDGLAVFQRAQRSSRAHAVRLVLAGAGPLEAALREQAVRCGVAVAFLGFINQSELPRVYAACDLFVLASESETWGLSVNEAMACDLPALVSDRVGCAPDLIDPGLTGEVFAACDPSSFAAALERFLPRLGKPSTTAAVRAKSQRYGAASALHATLRALNTVVARAGRSSLGASAS